MKNEIKISWIIPVFNAGSFLDDAITSLNKNRVDGVAYEILLIDDCSTDSVTQRVLSECALLPDVKLFRLQKNIGPAGARNIGIRAATGDWVSFLDADDMIADDTVALRMYIIRNAPDVKWIAGDMVEMRSVNELSYFDSFPKAKSEGAQVFPSVFYIPMPLKKLASWGMLPSLGSMMFRRDMLLSMGLIEETLVYGEDIHFCLVAASKADLYWIAEPKYIVRRTHASMTKDLLRGANEAPKASKMCMRDPRLTLVRREMRWQHAANLRRASHLFLLAGRRWPALVYAFRALFWSPNDSRSVSALMNTVRV